MEPPNFTGNVPQHVPDVLALSRGEQPPWRRVSDVLRTPPRWRYVQDVSGQVVPAQD